MPRTVYGKIKEAAESLEQYQKQHCEPELDKSLSDLSTALEAIQNGKGLWDIVREG